MKLICNIATNEDNTKIIDKITDTELSWGGGQTSVPITQMAGPFGDTVNVIKLPIIYNRSDPYPEYVKFNDAIMSRINSLNDFTIGFWIYVYGNNHDNRGKDMGKILTFLSKDLSNTSFYLEIDGPNISTPLINSRNTSCIIYETDNDGEIIYQKYWAYVEIYFRMNPSDKTYSVEGSLNGTYSRDKFPNYDYPYGFSYENIHSESLIFGQNGNNAFSNPIYDFFIVDGILHTSSWNKKPTQNIIDSYIHPKIFQDNQEFYGLPK